ncbi:MAG TPA: SMP-30/gluconolactonase/LRE family protein [Calditrichaeota bacterium]|nr:SMP-30/gluconolactonase/LRE family protein [Calditrichota bacterium]
MRNKPADLKMCLYYKKYVKTIFSVLTALFLLFSCNQQNPFGDTQWTLVGKGFSFPEGPAWDGKNILYVSNCYGDWMAKITADNVDTLRIVSDSSFKQTNGLIVDGQGNILACDFGLGAILKITPDGLVERLTSGFNGQRFNRPNDLVLTEKGHLYFSDPKSYGKDKADGRLFYFNFSTSQLTLAADSLCFPNGLAISPLDGKLYVSESARERVLRFTRLEDGALTDKEVFIELPGGDPDGLDFDVYGNLYVPHFGSGTLFVIASDGKIIQKIQTPGKKPSNIEFGGKDLKTLYLTEDETNGVYKIKVNRKGFKIMTIQ